MIHVLLVPLLVAFSVQEHASWTVSPLGLTAPRKLQKFSAPACVSSCREESKYMTVKALSIRGGGGPLDREIVAQTFTVLAGVQALSMLLWPRKIEELFKLKSDSPVAAIKDSQITDWLMECSGTAVLKMAIISWCLFFEECSIHEAVGLATIAGSVQILRSIINGIPQQFGASIMGHYLNFAIFASCAYALVTKVKNADMVVMVVALTSCINSLLLCQFPEKVLADKGSLLLDIGHIELIKYNIKSIVFNRLGFCTLIGSLAFGVDKHKAFGYSLIPPLLKILTLLLVNDGEADDIGVRKWAFWLLSLILAVGAGTLSF